MASQEGSGAGRRKEERERGRLKEDVSVIQKDMRQVAVGPKSLRRDES